MYQVDNLDVNYRLLQFACDIMSSGRRTDTLLKRWGLEYRKGKSFEDIQKARRLTFAKNMNSYTFEEEFAGHLSKVLKAVKS